MMNFDYHFNKSGRLLYTKRNMQYALGTRYIVRTYAGKIHDSIAMDFFVWIFLYSPKKNHVVHVIRWLILVQMSYFIPTQLRLVTH